MRTFPVPSTASAQLALDTIEQKPVRGIPGWLIHMMEHAHIERAAGAPRGEYSRHPEATYLAMQRRVGTCLLDQYIWDNPLTMQSSGFEQQAHSATTGLETVVVDGITIDSPEAVVVHLEQHVFPSLRAQIETFDEASRTREIIESEIAVQEILGPSMLKSGYGFIRFPYFSYSAYGYVNYFSAYALYPEVMERPFALVADLALLNNRAAARAFIEGKLPPLYRLDHDMADSRSTLVRVESLDRLWFPHFARCLEPVIKAGVRLIWHCDGNLMQMVPRLLETGIRGFQGFQYEDGMDYEKICRMKSRDGDDLIIVAGVSVTRTLPHGTPDDVRREMQWLVANGPRRGLFLGGSSTITPGVPWENVATFIEGLKYYQEHGREP